MSDITLTEEQAKLLWLLIDWCCFEDWELGNGTEIAPIVKAGRGILPNPVFKRGLITGGDNFYTKEELPRPVEILFIDTPNNQVLCRDVEWGCNWFDAKDVTILEGEE